MFGFNKNKRIKEKYLHIMNGLAEFSSVTPAINELIYNQYATTFIENYNIVAAMPPELQFESEYEGIKYAYQTTLCSIMDIILGYDELLAIGRETDASRIKRKLLPRESDLSLDGLVLALQVPVKFFDSLGAWERHPELEETAKMFLQHAELIGFEHGVTDSMSSEPTQK